LKQFLPSCVKTNLAACNITSIIDMARDQLQRLLHELKTFAHLDAAARAAVRRRASQLELQSLEDADSLIAALAERVADDLGDEELRGDHGFWAALLSPLGRLPPAAHRVGVLKPSAVSRAEQLYHWLGPPSQSRHFLLALLAGSGRSEALAAFAELIVADPPGRPEDATLAFVPLFQRRNNAEEALFPRLLDGLEHPAIAAAVLDLANYLTRESLTATHPASSRVDRLAELLGGLVSRLARVEERPDEFADSPSELNALVGDSVELIVSLCHALAMIGEPRVTGKLHQALELSHRRLRTEAAFALACLQDDRGAEALAQMASEPVVRPRALAYLEELGMLLRAGEADRSPEARAEGELAAWLASPMQFGLPPQKLELFDSRRQYWPGDAEAVDCYLFRYEYRLGDRGLSGIAIAGPVIHALRANLEDLPPADIYAAYAGWCAEHEEIGEISPEQLSLEQLETWEQRQAELDEQGYQDVKLAKLGRFFDEEHFVAAARRGGQPGVVIVDGEQIEWRPVGLGSRPLGVYEIYEIHKGRKLLRTFNPDF
jgi:hypothetical protein